MNLVVDVELESLSRTPRSEIMCDCCLLFRNLQFRGMCPVGMPARVAHRQDDLMGDSDSDSEPDLTAAQFDADDDDFGVLPAAHGDFCPCHRCVVTRTNDRGLWHQVVSDPLFSETVRPVLHNSDPRTRHYCKSKHCGTMRSSRLSCFILPLMHARLRRQLAACLAESFPMMARARGGVAQAVDPDDELANLKMISRFFDKYYISPRPGLSFTLSHLLPVKECISESMETFQRLSNGFTSVRWCCN